MKSLFTKLLFDRSSRVEAAIAIFCLAAFVLACGGGSSKPAKPIPTAYLGDWKAADGGNLTIGSDGTGKYISASGSAKFEGVAVNVDEADKSIKMTLLGVEVKKFSIDQPASGGQMKLDGIVYKNASGSTSSDTKSSTDDKKTSDTKSSSDDKKSPFGDTPGKTEDKSETKSSGSGDVPPTDEIDDLSGVAVKDFNDAVKKGSFDEFYGTISDGWKKQITADKFDEIFADFIKKKVDLTPKEGARPTYSPAPFINSDGLLEVDGSYPAKVGTVQFKLKYIKEGADWKLFGIRINT